MKKILMLLAFAGVASVASAQQTMTVTEYEVIQVQDKYQVITNPFWSNWWAVRELTVHTNNGGTI